MTFTVLRLYLKGSYGPVAKAWASSNTSTSAKKYLNSSSCVTTYQVMYSSSITCGRTLYFSTFLLCLAGVLFSKLPPPHPSSLTIACTVRWSDQRCHFRREFHAAATIWTKNANSKNQRQSKSSPGIHAGQCFSPGKWILTKGLCSASSDCIWKRISFFRQRENIQRHASISSVKTYMARLRSVLSEEANLSIF